MKNDVEQRRVNVHSAMNLRSAVVFDEPELSEFIEEEADSGSRGSDHFGERFLTDVWDRIVKAGVFAEVRQQQQYPCQPLLARIEELVDQVFFDPDVTCEQVRDEQLGKFRFFVKNTSHHGFLDFDDGALGDCRRRRHAHRLTGKTSLAKEKTLAQDRRDGFFPTWRHGCELDFASLNVKHGIGRVALRENDAFLSIFLNRPAVVRYPE